VGPAGPLGPVGPVAPRNPREPAKPRGPVGPAVAGDSVSAQIAKADSPQSASVERVSTASARQPPPAARGLVVWSATGSAEPSMSPPPPSTLVPSGQYTRSCFTFEEFDGVESETRTTPLT
jgi:hypothetical protein